MLSQRRRLGSSLGMESMKQARKHWSYSSISQYLRCSLQFYFERVLGIPRTTTSSGLALGSAVHSALATYHLSVAANDPDPAKHVIEAFDNSWKEREKRNEIDYKQKESRDSVMQTGRSLLETYLADPIKDEIVAVEERVLVPLEDSTGDYLETPIVVIADLVTRDESGLRINEFKTSGRVYSEFEVANSLQATFYVNGLHETFGEWPASVEYNVLVKTKMPKLQRIRTNRYREDVMRLGDLVATVERAVDAEIFYPNPSAMNCAGCQFKSECADWKPTTSEHQSEEQVEALVTC